MKRLSFLFVITLFVVLCTHDANAKNERKEFKKTVDLLMDVSFQSDSLGLVKVMNEFKRFTEDQELAYLAHYYIAFAKWQSVLRQTNISVGSQDAIQMLDDAIAELEIATNLREDFADAYALSLNCHYPLFYLQPQRRSEMGAAVVALRKKALELGPQNPRVVLTHAQNIFYSPEQYGGSQERGIERYLEAIRLFENESNKQSDLLPDWGHEVAYAWLGNAYFRLNEPNVVEAKEAFEKALELRPDFAWVKDIMMPQIKSKMRK